MADSRTFIISRADAIGDVVLTLPVAGILKSLFPGCRVIFLGRAYTREVIGTCEHIDGFLNWDEVAQLPHRDAVALLAAVKAHTLIHVLPDKKIAFLARQAGIPQRIGTTNRLWHWYSCNTLVKLSRRKSPYHEAQLNCLLLRPLGGKRMYTLAEIPSYYGLTKRSPLPAEIAGLIDPARFNLILHPKSRGHGREWGLDNFMALVELLPVENYKVFVTGTAEEGRLLQPLLQRLPAVTDMTGRMNLNQFISFIAAADGLIASGTGPLHLAAALGIHAIGMFPPIRPIHPGRWAPLGPGAAFFVLDKTCNACRETKDCFCIRAILPQRVRDYLQSLLPARDAGSGSIALPS
jgi:heptosyltransferase III